MTIMKWMRLRKLNIRRGIGSHCIPRDFFVFGILTCSAMGLSVAAFSSLPVFAQEPAGSVDTESLPANSGESSIRNYAGVSFKAVHIRDPFLNPLLKKEGKKGDQEIDRGLPPPGIAGTYIAEADLKGISLRENHRLAIIKGSGNRAYFLREGDRLFDGYLKTIHRDSITLVRETKMRSGKVIAQEVTKKLRTP